MCRFQQGLDEIWIVIGDHSIFADLWARAREIVKLEAKGRQDKENSKEIHANRRKLENENDAIANLVESMFTKYWGCTATLATLLLGCSTRRGAHMRKISQVPIILHLAVMQSNTFLLTNNQVVCISAYFQAFLTGTAK